MFFWVELNSLLVEYEIRNNAISNIVNATQNFILMYLRSKCANKELDQ